jgi:hypothetical protein
LFPPNVSGATATSANDDDGAGCVQYIFIPVGVPHAVSLVSAGHRIVAKASVHLVLTELSFELPAVVKDTHVRKVIMLCFSHPFVFVLFCFD